MPCPYCEHLNKSSYCLNMVETSKTLVAFDPHYDKKNRLHIHDPNEYYEKYRCDSGHEFRISYKIKCWCQ